MATFDQVHAARAVLARLVAQSGDTDLHQVITRYGPVDALARLSGPDLPSRSLHSLLAGVTGEQLRAQAAAVAGQAARAGARVVIPEDDEWPTTLPDAASTPTGPAGGAALCLWVRGDRPLSATLHRSVAVVGARAATAYGTTVAEQLGFDLASAGWTVVGTGAYGINAAGLRGALTGDGAAMAVLPAGVDRPYPLGNANLFDQIAARGLLVSPWPPGTEPTRERFTSTGRLLAALTGGTVLVEAGQRSGALVVLDQAMRMGRPAMVVPGPVTSALSVGAHRALRDHRQARLVRDAADVITELGEPTTATE